MDSPTADDLFADAAGPPPVARPGGWPYLRTPLWLFCTAMGPVCALQAFILALATPPWMQLSAAAVLAISLLALYRGYYRRLVLTAHGVRFRRLFGSIEIEWSRVRRVGVYVPGGGLGATEYLYVTTREQEPPGKWDIDVQTIQIQDRPGALHTLRAAWRAAVSEGPVPTEQ